MEYSGLLPVTACRHRDRLHRLRPFQSIAWRMEWECNTLACSMGSGCSTGTAAAHHPAFAAQRQWPAYRVCGLAGSGLSLLPTAGYRICAVQEQAYYPDSHHPLTGRRLLLVQLLERRAVKQQRYTGWNGLIQRGRRSAAACDRHGWNLYCPGKVAQLTLARRIAN